MNVLVGIAQFIVNEILSSPAYLIGIITAVGLIALRKTTGQVVGVIDSLPRVAEVLGDIVTEAEATLERLAG